MLMRTRSSPIRPYATVPMARPRNELIRGRRRGTRSPSRSAPPSLGVDATEAGARAAFRALERIRHDVLEPDEVCPRWISSAAEHDDVPAARALDLHGLAVEIHLLQRVAQLDHHDRVAGELETLRDHGMLGIPVGSIDDDAIHADEHTTPNCRVPYQQHRCYRGGRARDAHRQVALGCAVLQEPYAGCAC